jgi:hypothetical protein
MSYADKLVRRAELRRKMGDAKLAEILMEHERKKVAAHAAQHIMIQVRRARHSA